MSLPNQDPCKTLKRKATSTVGRGKVVKLDANPSFSVWSDEFVTLCLGNSFKHYDRWEQPTAIVSDGAYGVLGFEGDTSDHLDLPEWYKPHIQAWSKAAMPCTTLWFWNSEIGWAVVHPILEKYGWRYVNCNIRNKGKGHISLFCHSPVFPMISNFQSHVIVNDLGWGDRIFANFALSGIATLKKWRDRLLCVNSRIQKMQVFSESDRRGIYFEIKKILLFGE